MMSKLNTCHSHKSEFSKSVNNSIYILNSFSKNKNDSLNSMDIEGGFVSKILLPSYKQYKDQKVYTDMRLSKDITDVG